MAGRGVRMKMTPAIINWGAVFLFVSVAVLHYFLPAISITDRPSDIHRPLTALEEEGRRIYVRNGCTYCHTQQVRSFDWDIGAERISQAGDYVSDEPHLLGTQRTGPDLTQEGGEHPDDWHVAHFINPRFVRPDSIMPSWEFLGPEQIRALIAYKQSLGFKMADYRMRRQLYWKEQAQRAFRAGPERNVEWLHSFVPEGWRKIPNPYPTTKASLARGHKIYQSFCIGCHGPIGDGMGPAQPYLDPPPLNLTILKNRGVTGGILYYQIMNGITGTAMPYFKKDLESEKIWDVGNYVAYYFIGKTDADTEPKGIDASLEPPPAEHLRARELQPVELH